MKYLSLYVLIVTLYSTWEKCGFDYLKKAKRIWINQNNETSRSWINSKWSSLRIHWDFSQIENNISLINKKDYDDWKEKVLPKTKEVLETLWTVKSVTSGKNTLKWNATSCDDIIIPEKYKTEGVDADLVIFVSIDTTGFYLKNHIEAAAIHCLQDAITHRPVAGYIQFKPDLKIENDVAIDYMAWLALHELSHVLVFNEGLFRDFIDDEVNDVKFSDIIDNLRREQGNNNDNRRITVIKSKNVIKHASEHFNCSDIQGIPWEYNGGSGTAGGHWSKKYMNTDYMIGDSYGENWISNITLALFEDSGWYKPNYNWSNLFIWGKNSGCGFFNTSIQCVHENADSRVKTDFDNSFCTQWNYPVCSTGNIFRANCRGRKYERGQLNDYEKYFRDQNIGGSDMWTDKCPIPIESKNGQNYYGGSCRYGNNSTLTKVEKICANCACMMGNIQSLNNWRVEKESEEDVNLNQSEDAEWNRGANYMKNPLMKKVKPDWSKEYQAMCIEYQCENGELFVIAEGKVESKVKCEKEYDEVDVRGYKGKIQCPDPDKICNDKYKCKFGCVDQYK